MQIPLSNGGFATIDDCDVERVKGFKWRRWDDNRRPGRSKYAGYYKTVNGKVTIVYLHRMIIGAVEGQFVDHIDGDGLNNRKSNLRLATHQQNRANSRVVKPSKSGFRGVYSCGRRWFAGISNGAHSIHVIGKFDTREDAARAYDLAASQRYGQFARLNFPEQRVS